MFSVFGLAPIGSALLVLCFVLATGQLQKQLVFGEVASDLHLRNASTHVRLAHPRLTLAFSLGATAFVLAFFHRVAPGAIAADLRSGVRFDATVLGFIAALYFYPYAAMQLPSACLPISIGPRRLFTAGSVVAGPARWCSRLRRTSAGCSRGARFGLGWQWPSCPCSSSITASGSATGNSAPGSAYWSCSETWGGVLGAWPVLAGSVGSVS